MKRMLLICAMLGLLASCQLEKEDVSLSEKVSFTIELQLPSSGSMTRTAASELYDEFYTNYIETHIKLPNEYYLTIYKGDSKVVAISGKWDADIVTLPVGVYRVVGHCNGDFENGTLKFDEEITIDKNTKSISLTAQWDCYLLMFDKELYTMVGVECRSLNTSYFCTENLCETEALYYVFLPHRGSRSINYTVKGDNTGTIYLDQYPFEMGRYYVFNLSTGTFSTPPMEPGN